MVGFEGTSPLVDKPRGGALTLGLYQKHASSLEMSTPWCRLLSQSSQVISSQVSLSYFLVFVHFYIHKEIKSYSDILDQFRAKGLSLMIGCFAFLCGSRIRISLSRRQVSRLGQTETAVLP